MAGRKREKRTLGSRLGQNIAARRAALGWTQAELAERIGVNTETVSRFERGAHLPALTTLEEIANALRTGMAELLGEVPFEPGDRAVKVAAWIDGLRPAEQAFVLEQVKHSWKFLSGRSEKI